MTTRRWISLMVLLLQAAGLLHLTLERHLLATDGTWHDAQTLVAEAHQGEHVCSPEEGTVDAPAMGCAVLASWNTPGLWSAADLTAPACWLTRQPSVPSRERAWGVDVLAFAPKASPPARC